MILLIWRYRLEMMYLSLKKNEKLHFAIFKKQKTYNRPRQKKLKTITKINRYKKPESITQQNEKEKDKNKKQVMKQPTNPTPTSRSEEHTSELQSRGHLVCRLLLEKKKKEKQQN